MNEHMKLTVAVVAIYFVMMYVSRILQGIFDFQNVMVGSLLMGVLMYGIGMLKKELALFSGVIANIVLVIWSLFSLGSPILISTILIGAIEVFFFTVLATILLKIKV